MLAAAAQISARRYHPFLLLVTLYLWHRTLGSVNVADIASRKAETFYWATIMFSQTLGTALGDWMADETVGDFLDKPRAAGGLEMSRYWATAALAVFIVFCIAVLPKRAERRFRLS